ncbi:hypothetical protein SAMN04487905_111159 [Actinopolyspora xinjiangensis]|uniref:Uncharacterized protein n=1 Tax=Actinopolyspora xinjiangensis TaxID=405564 RepID=A0A1H0WC47_9ACTN|nr:hypothetical protein [Actinopolyspora xinjiangensis]SDP88025.1 hypothetical protein SAMN04487905_111159 [Actinopolyspora xinjiangensis]
MKFNRSTSLVTEVLDGEELAATESPLEDWDRLAVLAYWHRVVVDEVGEVVEEAETVPEGPVAEVVSLGSRRSGAFPWVSEEVA